MFLLTWRRHHFPESGFTDKRRGFCVCSNTKNMLLQASLCSHDPVKSILAYSPLPNKKPAQLHTEVILICCKHKKMFLSIGAQFVFSSMKEASRWLKNKELIMSSYYIVCCFSRQTLKERVILTYYYFLQEAYLSMLIFFLVPDSSWRGLLQPEQARNLRKDLNLSSS